MSPAERFRPGKLQSLWEVMRPFRAVAFLNFLELLHQLGMHKRETYVSGRLGSIAERFATSPDLAKLFGGPEWEKQNLGDISAIRQSGLLSFTHMESECISLELIASLATVRKLKAAIAQPNSTYNDLYPLAEEFRGRLIDEMAGKALWVLTVTECEYYDNPRKGWDEIVIRFPDSITDIEEASKCFALSRYAASVFHTIQVVEVGLIELGRLIVVTDPQKGWNATINRLNKILSTNYRDRTPFQQQNSLFLEQINATVEALKSAWRNKISHAQGKLTLLTRDFTPEVAEEILFATRSFMRRLATESPTSPDPDV